MPTLAFKIKVSTSVFSSKGFFLCGEFLLPCNIHRKHPITSNLQRHKLFSNGYSHASQELHPPLSPTLCITSINIFCRWVFLGLGISTQISKSLFGYKVTSHYFDKFSFCQNKTLLTCVSKHIWTKHIPSKAVILLPSG